MTTPIKEVNYVITGLHKVTSVLPFFYFYVDLVVVAAARTSSSSNCTRRQTHRVWINKKISHVIHIYVFIPTTRLMNKFIFTRELTNTVICLIFDVTKISFPQD